MPAPELRELLRVVPRGERRYFENLGEARADVEDRAADAARRSRYREAYLFSHLSHQLENYKGERAVHEYAVEPVEHAAVSRDYIPRVLDAGLALEHRLTEVAELPRYSAEKAEQQQRKRREGEYQREQAAAHKARRGFRPRSPPRFYAG